MVEFTHKHLEIVMADVDRADISYLHLSYDLIDHICCDIENAMSQGVSFEKAYSLVKEKIGIRVLQQIQEDTLLLIDKKYRIMKNTMKFFGVIAPILMSFGALFKIEHWPGAGIILTLGFFLLTFIFLPSAVCISYKEVSNRKRLLAHLSGFLAGFLVAAGFLFKIQHWPGTRTFILIGIPLPFILFLPAYFLSIRHNKNLNYNNILLVLFFFGYFAAITALLSKNTSKNVLNEYIISAYQYDHQSALTYKQMKAVVENVSYQNEKSEPKNQPIRKIMQKTESLYNLIDRIKIDILSSIDHKSKNTVNAGGSYNLWNINGLDYKSIYENEKFVSNVNTLKNNLAAYKKLLVTTTDAHDTELDQYISNMLNQPDDWMAVKFEGKHLIAVIDALNAIKSHIGSAGLEAILSIRDHYR